VIREALLLTIFQVSREVPLIQCTTIMIIIIIRIIQCILAVHIDIKTIDMQIKKT